MAHDDHHKHFVGMVAQKALIERDGKILLVQYPEGDGDAAGKWDLPGGRLHDDEVAIEGLKREVKEEIGAAIEVMGIITTLSNHGVMFNAFVVIYRAVLANPEQSLTPEPGEIGKIEWRDKKDLFTLPLASPSFNEALKTYLQ
jgi:8-oxo-dGTP pyrophosphatase MutT (NUDIX family)